MEFIVSVFTVFQPLNVFHVVGVLGS